MPWAPGQSGNPKGRKVGWRKPKERITIKQAAARGDADALDFLSKIVADNRAGTPFRLQAAIALAPYQHARVTARFIREEIDLPVSTSVEQATETIAKIGALAAAGKIGLDEANDLVSYQGAFIESKLGTETEQRLAAIEQALARAAPTFDVTVVGGLPNLPGSSTIMPSRTLTPPLDRDRDGNGGVA